MNLKVHYFITLSVLFFLGIIVTKPDSFNQQTGRDRVCVLAKGKMNCASKFTEYRMSHVANVKYKFN